MNLETIKVGLLQTNCYILELSGKVLVIDPGDDYYILKRSLVDKDVVGILVTHSHDDHIGAIESIVDACGAPVYSKNNLREGRQEIGPFHFEVIYTPGHSSDSVTYYFYEYNFMFSGDFIFKNTVGRMDLPTGNVDDMRNSLAKIYEYDDHITIYPGHGDKTTLMDEKRTNQYFNWIKG